MKNPKRNIIATIDKRLTVVEYENCPINERLMTNPLYRLAITPDLSCDTDSARKCIIEHGFNMENQFDDLDLNDQYSFFTHDASIIDITVQSLALKCV